jgi:hypothetical protein
LYLSGIRQRRSDIKSKRMGAWESSDKLECIGHKQAYDPITASTHNHILTRSNTKSSINLVLSLKIYF